MNEKKTMLSVETMNILDVAVVFCSYTILKMRSTSLIGGKRGFLNDFSHRIT